MDPNLDNRTVLSSNVQHPTLGSKYIQTANVKLELFLVCASQLETWYACFDFTSRCYVSKFAYFTFKQVCHPLDFYIHEEQTEVETTVKENLGIDCSGLLRKEHRCRQGVKNCHKLLESVFHVTPTYLIHIYNYSNDIRMPQRKITTQNP